MAKKPLGPLNFIDIVTRADADLIRQALEAREKIDDLLVLREEAYRKIAEVENSIEELVGQEKVFQFDPPPYSVAGMKGAQPYRPKPKLEEEVADSLDVKKDILAASEDLEVSLPCQDEVNPVEEGLDQHSETASEDEIGTSAVQSTTIVESPVLEDEPSEMPVLSEDEKLGFSGE